MLCPACVTEMPEDDLFCENCGLKLGDPGTQQPGCVCGAAPGETDEDGFCLTCGRRAHATLPSDSSQPRNPDSADHLELALSPDFAVVSDRGMRHARNEDRFGIFEAGGRYAIVVCDGVSTTRSPEVASAAVSEGVLSSLAETLHAAGDSGTLDAPVAIRQAIVAGAARLAALEPKRGPESKDDNPPSTTVVAALVGEGAVTVGWLGDSRAYWLQLPDASGSATALQLTQDHSWLNDVVASGELTAEQADKSPQSHSITRWIGADSGSPTGELEPDSIDIVRYPLPNGTKGVLLLCTDGLWNYFPTPGALSGMVQNVGSGSRDALTIARDLVEFANRKGGHDNITACVLRYAVPQSADPTQQQERMESLP